MSDKSNNREIRLTWVQGPNTYSVRSIPPNAAADYEKTILDALWNDLNQRVAAKNIEQELLGSDFAEAKQVIERIKQQIRKAQ